MDKIVLYMLSGFEIFLATDECHDYLDGITKEDRKITLNTLLQLEKNISNIGESKNEKNKR